MERPAVKSRTKETLAQLQKVHESLKFQLKALNERLNKELVKVEGAPAKAQASDLPQEDRLAMLQKKTELYE